MPLTFVLTTPLSVGNLGSQTISSLQITGVHFTTTPALAPIGAGGLEVLLTDPESGVQEIVKYQDSSVIDLWTAQQPATAAALGDIIAAAIFNKLIADGKLPPGNLVSVDAPTGELTIEQRRQAVVTKIEKLKMHRYDQGFQFGDNWFYSNLQGQTDITGLCVSALLKESAQQPVSAMLITMTGDVVQFSDVASIAGLGAAFEAYRIGVAQAAIEHEAQIMQSDDPEGYDFTKNWPESYTDFQAQPKPADPVAPPA